MPNLFPLFHYYELYSTCTLVLVLVLVRSVSGATYSYSLPVVEPVPGAAVPVAPARSPQHLAQCRRYCLHAASRHILRNRVRCLRLRLTATIALLRLIYKFRATYITGTHGWFSLSYYLEALH